MCSHNVGIVILNYNCSDETLQCISVIEESLNNLNYKIFIVDNFSKLEEKNKLLNIENERVNIIFAPKNGGYSYGNNLGIKRALDNGCKNILIINPDVIIKAEAIEYMNNELNKNDKILFVGPKIVDSKLCIDKHAQRFQQHNLVMCYMLKFPLSKLNIGGCITKYFNSNRNFDENMEIYTTSGCCVMFSNKYFEKFGLFDEDFFMFSEEVIWGKNIHDTEDFKAMYLGQVTAIHNHPQNRLKTKPYVITNRMMSDFIFCKKYLKCNNMQLIPLIGYYIITYLSFSLIRKEFREYCENFIGAVKKIYNM